MILSEATNILLIIKKQNIMKQLLLILSCVLFFCSCEKSYNLETHGTLEKLEGNTARISNITIKDAPETITFAPVERKDCYQKTDLKARGQEIFVYSQGDKFFLSELNAEEIDAVNTDYDKAMVGIIAIFLGGLMTIGIGVIFTDGDEGATATLWGIVCILIPVVTGIVYGQIKSTAESKVIDYGSLTANEGYYLLYKENGAVSYKNITFVGNKRELPQSVALVSKGSKINAYPCDNKERMEATVAYRNQNLPDYLKDILIWGMLVELAALALMAMLLHSLYADKLKKFFQRKKKQELEEEISEDGRTGNGHL